MKILFINPSLRPESERRQLPVGLGYIMTAVSKAGFSFDLIDMDVNRLTMNDLKQLLQKTDFDICALGCIVTGFKFVRQIANIVKDVKPDSIIIAGNSVATSIPVLLLKNTLVDIAVLGEGDITIVEILKTLEVKQSLEEVQGIAYKSNNEILFTQKRKIISNIDSIEFPDWNLFELDKYEKYSYVNSNCFSKKKIIAYPLNSARGCPFNCTFCYHVFKGEKYRRYSINAIIEEINRLHDLYNCDFVSFWDELTFPTFKSIQDFLENIKKLKFQLSWAANVRGGLFNKKHVSMLRDLREYGCENLHFSLENASSEILSAMNKKMSVSQFVEQAIALHKSGITPLTSVIFGYPQETTESIKKTLKICEECNMYPSVGYLLLQPGTSIYDWAKSKGYIQNELEFLEKCGDRQDFTINLTKMSDEEFQGTVNEGLKELAKKMGLDLPSVLKTTKYKIPKKDFSIN